MHLRSKSNGLHFTLKNISRKYVPEIFKTGFTSFLLEISSGIVMFVFNLQILRYIGDVGVSVYGIITNTMIVVNCLCNGVNQAAQPIVSVNFGAGLKDRVINVRNLGIKMAFVVCTSIAVLGFVVPDAFTYMFLNPTPEVLEFS